MALIRWQQPEVSWPTFDELSQLRAEMDRFLDLPFTGLGRNQFNEWAPAVDLYENKDNVIVRAEIPGMKKENIDVSLHNGALTISGERKVEEKREEGTSSRSERFVGRFQRTITLPTMVDGTKVKASYKDGILTVTLPKAEEAKPRQIEVSVS